LGPAWTDTGMVFTREDGQALHLILGNREEDDSSAVNPLSTGPQVHEAQEGGDARHPQLSWGVGGGT
jgi:hypothetical protein